MDERGGRDLVFLAEAGDNVEASILRAFLEDHGVFVYLQGENHRALLGQVGAYIPLRLLVPAEQLEEARELVERFRDDVALEEPPEFRGAFRDGGLHADEEEDADEAWKGGPARRREIRAARLVALSVPFGGGHFATGAWAGGLFLATVFAVAVAGAITRAPVFLVLAALVPLVDWYMVPGLVDARRRRRS